MNVIAVTATCQDYTYSCYGYGHHSLALWLYYGCQNPLHAVVVRIYTCWPFMATVTVHVRMMHVCVCVCVCVCVYMCVLACVSTRAFNCV